LTNLLAWSALCLSFCANSPNPVDEPPSLK